MGKKTINQALKDLFLGLGGDSSALADNSSVSDYIEDLESAIKGAAAGAQINDETASTTTVYSSSKTEDLIEAIPSLPSVTSEDIGKVLSVVSDGESGAEWSVEASSHSVTIATAHGGTSNSVIFDNLTIAQIVAILSSDKEVKIRYAIGGGTDDYYDLAYEGFRTNT